MSPAGIQNHRLIDWAVASRPLPGQTVSGDLHLVESLDYGVLMAVVDGVGHGADATVAARATVAALKESPGEPVDQLVRHCHAVLGPTRGAVMSLARLNALRDTVSWLGVGNVEGRLIRADARAARSMESMLVRSGTVGLRLPALQASVVPIATGDLLIFATDGIHPGFAEDLNWRSSPQRIADDIMARHFKGNDDALVLVVRHLGLGHG
jgi:negative regulator of sigma-B (phosphoserine phosphatase)